MKQAPSFQLPDNLNPAHLSVAVVVSRFNEAICDNLLVGAAKVLSEVGLGEVVVERVPGAFEIPLAALTLAETGRFDAVICLGVVIRGGTPHFDYVCQGVTQGIMQVQLETGVPCGFGILTVDDESQALERSSDDEYNKGRLTAQAMIEMISFQARYN